MNCSHDVWETAFQTTSIGEKQINVILSLLHNFIQLFADEAAALASFEG